MGVVRREHGRTRRKHARDGPNSEKKAGRRHKTSFLRSAAALLQSLIPRATEQETIGNGAFHPAKHSLT